jgi:hypothetical protein
MRVPEAEFRRKIEEKLGEEQLLTSEQIMMYNISTKTGESSLFPEYTFKVGYENGYYRLTITKKAEKVCGRIPEKAHLPPDIRSLKKGNSKTYTRALMWTVFKCENVVEYDGGLLFYQYPDYTIDYNPISDDYTITRL